MMSFRRWTLFLIAAVLIAAVPREASAQEYDVLIRGGRVLDGSGNPWRQADVALRGDRIAAVGDLAGATAHTVIDAAGRYVAPGFIDVHSHAGSGLTDDTLSAAEPLLAQGITTVVINPDGGGAADLTAQREALLEHGLGVNAAPLVPHSAIRDSVLGMADRAPTADELNRMTALVRQGMEAGGFGLSTGPFYAPGSYAATDEFVALSEVAAEYGGVYQSHIRDESNYTVGLIAAVDEVITIAREAGLPGIVTHVKALGPPVWGFSEAVVTRIERARSEGVEVFADQYPYEASATSLAAALLPRWAEAGGRDSLVMRIRTPETRERMLAAMEANLARRGGAGRIQFRTFSPDPSIEGQTLAAVAQDRGQEPLGAALDLIEQENPGIVSFNMKTSDVRRFMEQPWTMTCSDGGLVAMGEGVPHPRNYGAFPRKLRRYVMEDEVVDLGFAIRSMTHLSASVMGIGERGLLRPGAYADVVVFDPERLRDTAEFQDPHQLAEGMEQVIVNGQFAVRDGAFTGARPGRVLHRQQP
jgi:N-acyl-D-aspartate/D-glutamate deacylase